MNSMTRRDWLTAGAAGLAASSVLKADSNVRAKARKNLKLGVFTSVYSKLRLGEAARRIQADGFSEAVLQFAFADVRFDPSAPDWGAAREILRAFKQHGVRIAALAGYYNVVDPDAARRARGEQQMRFLLANWERLGSRIVCTETGTLNAQSEWSEAPENQTEAAYLQCRSILTDLAKAAAATDAVLAIEPYWKNVIDSAPRAERLFREAGSPNLKLVMDACNYYRKSDLARMQPVLEDIFARVGGQTVIAHAKDVKASPDGTDLPASGMGVLDYPLYLRLLARLDREIPLIIEHLDLADVPRARDFVLRRFEEI
jgi:sugar phosphate isomerase/epimerase